MRPTREVVVVVLTIAAAACLVLSVGGLLAIELFHPETDTTTGLRSLWHVVAAIFSGLGGYVIGRTRNGS